MLTPTQVIPFLRHDDPKVRRHAADYLTEAHDPAPATADDFLAAIERFGVKETRSLIRGLGSVPPTEAVYQWLVQAVRAETDDEDTALVLQDVFESLDFDLLSRHRDEVLGLEQIKPEIREHLRQRLDLASEPVEPLWDRLMQFGQEVGDKYLDQFDYRVPARLVEALARRPEFSGERALAVLRDSSIEDWREIFCVDLVGEARYRPAIDALIEKYLIDADFLLERVSDALVRMGDAEVVQKLEAFFAGKPWETKLFAAQPFERIKLPESEAALVRLLAAETEHADIRTFLASGLCMLCTTEGLEAVRALIVEDRYDPEIADLPDMLLTAGVMAGYEPPEAAEWRKRIADDEARRARMFPDTASLLENLSDRLGSRVPGSLGGEIRLGTEARLSPPARRSGGGNRGGRGAAAAPAALIPSPVPRTSSPKVGRNDPCPCGSGKKYKKCCLAKGL